jgi:hypothetical protein
MSRRNEAEARTIHPRALAELGEEACIVVLGIGRDLRSGVIRNAEFCMTAIGGLRGAPARPPCCIFGHMRNRGCDLPPYSQFIKGRPAARSLFHTHNASDPILAADAIERYVYDGSETPWRG